jgi:transposase-like protein
MYIEITTKSKGVVTMRAYQNKAEKVKKEKIKLPTMRAAGSIQIVDEAPLLAIAEEGMQSLCRELGFEALRQILEQEVEALAGPKGKHDAKRSAYRHGTEQTKVVLGGEKISFRKPRVRGNGHDLQLPSLAVFQDEDPLNRTILTRMLCGVSTRKYARTLETDANERGCTSKSEASRRYNVELKRLADEFFNRQLRDEYPVIMLDGMSMGSMMVITAMGITAQGEKKILGLRAGGTENSIAVKELLADLIERGLQPDRSRLFALDGSKALAKAVHDTFGLKAQIQRCQVHKKRNVLAHLPQSEQANVGFAISKAYLEFDYKEAKRQLELLAKNLEYRYPDASASLMEGLEETLTVHRLEIPALLRKTLANTNAMESANSVAAGVVRRIRKWADGGMILRHMAAAFCEAERGFRRIQGYRQIPILITALNNSMSSTIKDSLKEETA